MQTQAELQKDSAFESISQLWKRRKWLAIISFVLTFAAAASFVSSLPDIYSASATVLVNPQTQTTDPTPGPAGNGQDSRLDSVSEEVMTRERLLGLIDRFNLYPSLRKSASEETVLDRMRKDISVQRKAGQQQWGQDPTFAFTLSYQGWDPKVVADVTNALASSFVDANNKMRSQQATATMAALQTQMSEIKRKLDAQEQKINAFRTSHMGELPEQQAANIAMLQQLSSQLHENGSAWGESVQQQSFAADRSTTDTTDLAQLEQQLTALRAHYTDAHPDVVRLKAQIAALKRNQASAGPSDQGSQNAALDGTIQSYRDEDSHLRQQMAIYQQRIDNMPLREQQLDQLMQGYSETRDVYSSLLKRYEEVALPQGPGNSQYRVLETAVAPTDASGPGRLRLLLMSLVFSLGLAAALVFLAEQFDPSFHNVDQLRAFTRVPVLANIPMIVTPEDVWRRKLRFGTAVLSALIVMLLVAQASSLLGHGNQSLVWALSRHAPASS